MHRFLGNLNKCTSKGIAATFLYIIGALFFVAACSGDKKQTNLEFTLSLHDAPPQNAQERQKVGMLESYASINLGEHQIFIPELISVSESGAIAILDYGQMNFNLIEPRDNFSGSTHTVLPIRPGRGPGEFQNPMEILFTVDNELLLIDPPNAKLMYYTLEGELIREQSISERPHRMALTDDRIIFAYLMGEKLFSTMLRETGESAESFGEIPTPAPLLKQGDLSTHANKVVFMPYGLSWFALFTDRGELLYQASTIELIKQPDETLQQLKNYPTSRPDSFKFINSSVQLLDDMIVILHSGDSIGNIANTIDTYSITDGEYLSSFTLDAPANLIRIRGNTLYTRSRNKEGEFLINIYDFRPSKLSELPNK